MDEASSDWPQTLEWIESQARESLKARFATAEIIAKEAQTTLTVFLAGVGGSAAYASKVFEPGAASPTEIASAWLCVYLMVLTVSLVLACMMFKSYPALAQDPESLMQPTFSLVELREQELRNIGDRIREAASINATRASRLNSLRLAAALSPFLFAVVAGLAAREPSKQLENHVVACSVELPASGAIGSLKCNISK